VVVTLQGWLSGRDREAVARCFKGSFTAAAQSGLAKFRKISSPKRHVPGFLRGMAGGVIFPLRSGDASRDNTSEQPLCGQAQTLTLSRPCNNNEMKDAFVARQNSIEEIVASAGPVPTGCVWLNLNSVFVECALENGAGDKGQGKRPGLACSHGK